MASILRPLVSAARSRCVCAPMSGRIPIRAFHASPSALKKSRSKQIIEEEEFDEAEESIDMDDDLFASSSTPTIRDPSAQLQPLLNSIEQIMALPVEKRKGVFGQMRVGTLRRIIQLYPSEEIEGLKGILRNWRALGGRVTRKTAEELVGRLCHLGKANLAVEIVNDRTQYGLPSLPTHTQSRLHQSLLQTESPLTPSSTSGSGIPISKTLATLRLALMEKTQQEPLSKEELSTLISSIKKVKVEVKEADQWRAQARGMLEGAGGMWADAAKRLEAVNV